MTKVLLAMLVCAVLAGGCAGEEGPADPEPISACSVANAYCSMLAQCGETVTDSCIANFLAARPRLNEQPYTVLRACTEQLESTVCGAELTDCPGL